MRLKNITVLLGAIALLASCKNGFMGKNKKEKSSMTGWNYNDKNMGGFNVAKAKDIKTGPGLVFVQGGTFTMGATTEDVMGDFSFLFFPMKPFLHEASNAMAPNSTVKFLRRITFCI